jgi:hypothetical protein
VDWNRYPDDVEPLIGIMLCREFPNAQRIRPSRGDRGIDVLVPGDGGYEVYQVKSFATNLGPSQKAQIIDSYERLKEAHVAKDINVLAWYLTLPLNPTNENLEWMESFTGDAGYPCHWRGLDFVDGLAAKYQDVIEYYLGDGRGRLDRAMQDLTAILRGRSGPTDEPLQPGDVSDDLRRIHAALNAHDPHFTYSFRVDHTRPQITEEPMLVAAKQVSDENSTITIYVFARYNEAVEDHPVPFSLNFDAPPDSQLAENLLAFYKFGVPFHAPLGSATIKVDLPGGLGGTWTGGSVMFGPARRDSAVPYVIRIQIINESGEEQAVTRLNMDPVSEGVLGGGTRAYGQEASGVFYVEILTDFEEQKVNLTVTPSSLAGKAPADVLPGLRFMYAFHHPNRFREGLPHGPFITESIEIPPNFGVDTWEVLGPITFAEALATIQNHTPEQLSMPNEAADDDVRAIVRAAKLLRGEPVSFRWNQWRIGVPEEFATGLPSTEAFTIAHDAALAITWDDKTISLGGQRVHFLTARVDPSEPPTTLEPGTVRLTLIPADSNEAMVSWLPDYVSSE